MRKVELLKSMPSNREKDKQRKVTGINMITVFREGELIILRDLHLWTMIKKHSGTT